jgi:hypothetical protein
MVFSSLLFHPFKYIHYENRILHQGDFYCWDHSPLAGGIKSVFYCRTWLLSSLCFYTYGWRRQRRYYCSALHCCCPPAAACTTALLLGSKDLPKYARSGCNISGGLPGGSSAALHNVLIGQCLLRPVRSASIRPHYVKAGQKISRS